ncbi:MAG: hypothetical protein LBN40_05640 [Oscillospiraceae bacterium]|jgi:hypothetical protein|nr:hypothetical protein [Oscillospiraceae bacterium]
MIIIYTLAIIIAVLTAAFNTVIIVYDKAFTTRVVPKTDQRTAARPGDMHTIICPHCLNSLDDESEILYAVTKGSKMIVDFGYLVGLCRRFNDNEKNVVRINTKTRACLPLSFAGAGASETAAMFKDQLMGHIIDLKKKTKLSQKKSGKTDRRYKEYVNAFDAELEQLKLDLPLDVERDFVGLANKGFSVRYCPKCGGVLPAQCGDCPTRIISVTGASGTGKTTYINAVAFSLEESETETLTLDKDASFPSIDDNLYDFECGERFQKTPPSEAPYISVSFSDPTRGGAVFILKDTPEETTSTSKPTEQKQRQLSKTNAALFLFDASNTDNGDIERAVKQLRFPINKATLAVANKCDRLKIDANFAEKYADFAAYMTKGEPAAENAGFIMTDARSLSLSKAPNIDKLLSGVTNGKTFYFPATAFKRADDNVHTSVVDSLLALISKIDLKTEYLAPPTEATVPETETASV